ncbi:MAG: glycosyltransferase family 4 protein [Proteobacteria bacterium]|nr:glycosyltransferase family 4 protein [Pseudomonadota bacterium]
MDAAKKSVVLFGPSLGAVSGVSTHLNQLLSSSLTQEFSLRHFLVGREGRVESGLARMFRFVFSPVILAGYLLRTRPDIVHLNTSINRKAFWRDLGYLFVARALRRRTVYQVHGGELPEDFAGHKRVRLALLRWVLGLPQAVVVLAQCEQRAYRQFVPATRVEVIPNAVDVRAAQDLAPRAATTAPLHVVYVGRLARTKGIFEILEAVRLLQDRGTTVQVTLAGDGPEAEALQALATRLGVAQRVRFAGPLFGADKDRLWSSADVFAFPTFHSEGLPYALLECMAFGVVPVTTAVAAIPDVMQDGVHGYLIPSKDPPALANAIARLDADRASLQRLSAASQQRIREHYTLERMAGEFRALYESL